MESAEPSSLEKGFQRLELAIEKLSREISKYVKSETVTRKIKPMYDASYRCLESYLL